MPSVVPVTNATQIQRLRPFLCALAIAVACLSGALVPVPVMAADNNPLTAPAEPDQTRFDIAPGPMATVLNRFASTAGITLSFDPAQMDGLNSNGVHGSYSVDEALRVLLTGTELKASRTGSGGYMVAAVHAANMLPAVKVGANAFEESAYGPVANYTATRSATATKMDIAIIDTPASIQVVSEKVIKDQNASSLKDVVRNVSGVRIDSTAGNRSESFTIRGFSSLRLARDGFLSPASFGDSSFVELSNLSRVEVLKGPASILYGQVEPGGLINLVTKKPLQEAFGRLSGTYGTDDYKLVEVDLNQPLSASGKLLGRLNASYRDGGDFRDYFVNTQRLLIAPSLRWLPSEKTTVDLQFEYIDQERMYDRGLVAENGNNLTLLPRERYLGESYSTIQSEDHRTTLSIEHSINSDWTLRALTQITNSDQPIKAVNPVSLQADGRTLNRNYQEVLWETENFGAQANLIGHLSIGAMDHDLLIGVDANQTKLDMAFSLATIDAIDIFAPVYGSKPGPTSFAGGQARDIDFYGIYINDLISLNRNWKVMLGGRYDIVETNYQANGNLLTDNKKDHEFSPRAGLIFQPTESMSFYLSYTESFAPPLSGASASGEEFKPEEGEQLELGVKREWMDGRLSTTFAIFDLVRKNVSTSDPENANFSIQTGEQRSRGLEIDVSGELTPGWNLLSSFSWMDSEIVDDNTYDEGNRLPNAPRLSGSLWTTYSFLNEPLSDWEIGAGIFASGEREGSLDNSFSAPGYATVDLLARYKFSPDVSISLNVKNLFDKYYIESTGGRLTWIEPGASRTILAKVDWSF
jgi:iron complex outermembrane receptor protein